MKPLFVAGPPSESAQVCVAKYLSTGNDLIIRGPRDASTSVSRLRSKRALYLGLTLRLLDSQSIHSLFGYSCIPGQAVPPRHFLPETLSQSLAPNGRSFLMADKIVLPSLLTAPD